MKIYITKLLVILTFTFGLSVSAIAGQGHGAYKLDGAWVAKVNELPGAQWSYVISADPSGRRASGHGSVDSGFNIEVLFGPIFEPNDSLSPILVNIVMTGPDTASYYGIWYGLKNLEAPSTVTTEVVFIGIVTGELKFVGPGKAHGTHNFALYHPMQDGDGDGFPDEGETAALIFPFPVTTMDTRLPLPE